MNAPFKIITDWLTNEKQLGCPSPNHAVLSTVSGNRAHSRVIAIREIVNESVIFFTQKGTRKVEELAQNPHTSLTFWLAMSQRQIILEGEATPLSEEDNQRYWDTYSTIAQRRFYAYAETSSQVIASKSVINDKWTKIKADDNEKPLPLSPYYVGFAFSPETLYFYSYRSDELSDVSQFSKSENNQWQQFILSP